MKKTIYMVMALVLWVVGCAEIPQPAYDLSCAGAHNDGQPSYCTAFVADKGVQFMSTANAYTGTVELGDISRGTMIFGEGIVDNTSAADFFGYAEFVFIDGGCNGATSWELMSKSAVTVPAGQVRDVIGAGGTCSDMALGPHTAVATVWQADGVTQVGQITIHFNLVQ